MSPIRSSPASTSFLIEQAMTAFQAKQLDPGTFDDAKRTLLAIVGHIIPASAEYDLPGADDPTIYADILRSVGRDRHLLGEALDVVDAMADGSFGQLPRDRQAVLLTDFRAAEPELASVIEAVTARCYYRDDRVVLSIGVEARPPFPLGYEVEEGDWSLLDPVRARGRIWR